MLKHQRNALFKFPPYSRDSEWRRTAFRDMILELL